MNRGVLYIAFGDKFIQEAIISASSFKKLHAGIPIALITNKTFETELFDLVIESKFDPIPLRGKAKLVGLSPFEKTLYVDSDTYFVENIEEIFELLKKFDFLLTHAPMRYRFEINVPDAFPDFNGGLIAFRKSDATQVALKNWVVNFDELNFSCDQPSLRKTIFDSTCRFYVLPPEYNYRTWLPGFIGGNSKVKILHGRTNNFKAIAQELNKHPKKPRIYLPNVSNTRIWHLGSTSKFGKIFIYFVRLKMNLIRSFKNIVSSFRQKKQ